jgi:hypothetical protein
MQDQLREIIPAHINHIWQPLTLADGFTPAPGGTWKTLCGYEWEGVHHPADVFYYDHQDMCPRCKWEAFPELRGQDKNDPSTWDL